jgi:hypothetical protein
LTPGLTQCASAAWYVASEVARMASRPATIEWLLGSACSTRRAAKLTPTGPPVRMPSTIGPNSVRRTVSGTTSPWRTRMISSWLVMARATSSTR